MCGINGLLRLTASAPELALEELRATQAALAARGPDGSGEWQSRNGRVALAHRRLAILDLSDAGLQPMASRDGRYHIVFNGEIYNFRQLRQELEARGERFRTESDTEVVLALYGREGVAMLPRLRGMYAFALWDESRGELLLARDPLGIKPLYYAEAGGVLRFGSQVKALLAGGQLSRRIDDAGLASFLLWGSVAEPRTLYEDVHAVPAGCSVLVRDGIVSAPTRHAVPDSCPAPALDPEAAIEDSVAAHLVSDVPVAVFLSAGLDSSLIAALARRHSRDALMTFTVTFDALAGTPLDEGPLAAETARVLGANHLERRIERADFPDFWQRTLAAMDQPSIDGFNTFVVSQVAREAGLKVVLSGLGGDEIFGSYPSFRDVPRLQDMTRRLRRIPGLTPVWPALSHPFTRNKPKLRGLLRHGQDLAGAYLLRRALFLPEELPNLLGQERARQALQDYDPSSALRQLLSGTHDDAAPAGFEPWTEAPGRPGAERRRLAQQTHGGARGEPAPGPGARTRPARAPRHQDPWQAVHALETGQYLRNQLLRDADWAGMAHGLEIRVPFVDAFLEHQLARQGFEPARSHGKAELVRRLAPELPPALFARPKSGFYIPILDWLEPRDRRSRQRSRRSLGRDSRRLALAVLAEHGVDLRD